MSAPLPAASAPRLVPGALASRHPGIAATSGVFAAALLAFLAIGAALPVLPAYVRGPLHAGNVSVGRGALTRRTVEAVQRSSPGRP